MRRELRCSVSEYDWQTVDDFVKVKRKWKKVSDFVRYAVFTEMARNKPGRHDQVTAHKSAVPVDGDY